ncbi:MAG: carboxypeptidase-like regulatory domain-containing protein [Bacteroidota bacterium]
MKIISTLLLLFTLISSVQAQEMEGKVSSSADSLPIEGVHIMNISANKMAVSTENGFFNIRAERGDTLVVSNVNFNTKQFIVNNESFLKISLNPAVIQLDEVRVSNLPETEAEFRERLVKMGVQEDDTFVPFGMKPNKPRGKIPKNYDPKHTNSIGYAINKPISFIVKKLSKSHKNKVKYYQTVASKGSVIENSKKFNPELVRDLTGLEEDDLTDFIKYLDFDPAFIKRSTEYEIAEAILRKFEQFKIQNG